MSDFIYDERGECVARIKDGAVLREFDGQKIAEARDGELYSLDGKLIGRLQNAHVVHAVASAIPEQWTSLLERN